MRKSLQDSVVQPLHTKAVIKAALKSPEGSRRVWCVVESDDDVEVFEKFFIPLIVSVLPSTNEEGKRSYHNVESIVTELYAEETSPKVFGIRDRDYTSFSPSYVPPVNVFLTDDKDLEMMLLKSQSVIEGLRRWNPDFPENVVRSANVMRFLGYIRIFNDIKQASCVFKDNLTKVSLIWDDSTHSVYADYKDRLFSKFQEATAIDVNKDEFYRFIEQHSLERMSIYDVCRGHDVCKLLCVLMIKKEYSRQKDLFKCMRDSYSFEDFSQTVLYSDLCQWAVDRSLSIFIMP